MALFEVIWECTEQQFRSCYNVLTDDMIRDFDKSIASGCPVKIVLGPDSDMTLEKK